MAVLSFRFPVDEIRDTGRGVFSFKFKGGGVRVTDHGSQNGTQRFYASALLRRDGRPQGMRCAVHTLRLSDAPRFTQYAPRATRYEIPDARSVRSPPRATESGDSWADLRWAGSGIWSKTCNTFLRAGGDIAEIFTVGGAGGYGGCFAGGR